MAFAQINYPNDKVGNGNYTIAEIGCFITAFCNLLQRNYGIDVDPPTLNQQLIDNDLYLADPADGTGVKDDVTWDTICKLYPQVSLSTVSDTGGWPPSSNIIVKFAYTSQRTGQPTTHFCLMADADGETIIDSWDGITKKSGEYGTPVAWASYDPSSTKVQAVVTAANPPTPRAPSVPANTVYTKLDEALNLVTNKQPTNWWKLDFTNDANAEVATTLPQGARFAAYGKAQRTDGDRPVYYMTQDNFGDADTTGIPTTNCGVNTVDLSPAPAALEAVVPPLVTSETPAASSDGEAIPVKVLPGDPNKWQQSYTAFLSPVKYLASKTETVEDVNDATADRQQLVKGALVIIAGTFEKDGYKYYRTQTSVTNDKWYALPVDSLVKDGDMTEEELDNLLKEAASVRDKIKNYSLREKLIIKFAKAEGKLAHNKK